MVECRYSKFGSAQQSLASVGYMVKTPTSILPTTVLSDGLYGVQLRLAKGRVLISQSKMHSELGARCTNSIIVRSTF